MSEPTLHIPSLTGVWRDVFDARERVHQAADRAVLKAWAVCVADADVDAAARAAVEALAARTFETAPESPSGSRRRLSVLTATVSAILYRMAHGAPWQALRDALAAELAQAWTAGWEASQSITSIDDDEPAPPPPVMTSVADTALATAARWITAGATKAAGAVLTGRTGGLRARIAKALRRFLRDPLGLRLAVDQAVSAAYTDGMTAYQQAAGVRTTAWVTAGDGRVCAACKANEEDGPYPAGQGPFPPAHPSCRCIPIPSAT